jgi:hypothetical protein
MSPFAAAILFVLGAWVAVVTVAYLIKGDRL